MIPLSLAEVAMAVGGVLATGGSSATAETLVAGPVETDSREIVAGGVFVAKPGEFTDGHDFLPAAVAAGAALLLVERDVPSTVPRIVVPDAVVALADLARVVVARVRAEGVLRVVGVTGSNGKTTTKNLLRAILEAEGPTVAPVGSFNNEVGAPITMLHVEHDTRFLVVEMGAGRPGDIRRLIDIVVPDIGVVLTVGLAHVGMYSGPEAVATEKSEMVLRLPETGVAVLNLDDPRVAGMAAVTNARVVGFGTATSATGAVRATDIEAAASGTRFTLHLPGDRAFPVAFRVLGEHHVTNALAAAAVADELGVPGERIAAALQSVVRAERWRMEVVASGSARGVTVINDAYNASPDSTAAALKTLAQISDHGGRKVVVLGEMAELGELSGPEHDRIGLLAVRLRIDRIVVVGEEARRLHISTINEGSWDGESVWFATADEAFDYLIGELRPRDTVLVKSSKSAGLRFLGDRLGESFS